MTDDQLIYAARDSIRYHRGVVSKGLEHAMLSEGMSDNDFLCLSSIDFDFLHSLAGADPHGAYKYLRNSVDYLISLEEWAEELD